MSAVEIPATSPRDVTNLANLKRLGLELVEVKLSKFSPVIGQRLESLRHKEMNEMTKPVCVVRNNRSILDLEAVFLEEGDIVYLLSNDVQAIRELFTILV